MEQTATYTRFWTQLVRWLAPGNRPTLRLAHRRLRGEPGRVHLEIEIVEESNSAVKNNPILDVKIRVANKTVETRVHPLGNGLYRLEFPLRSDGPPAHIACELITPQIHHRFPVLLVPARVDPEYSRTDDGRNRLTQFGQTHGGVETKAETLARFQHPDRTNLIPWGASLIALPLTLYLLALLVRPPKS